MDEQDVVKLTVIPPLLVVVEQRMGSLSAWLWVRLGITDVRDPCLPVLGNRLVRIYPSHSPFVVVRGHARIARVPADDQVFHLGMVRKAIEWEMGFHLTSVRLPFHHLSWSHRVLSCRLVSRVLDRRGYGGEFVTLMQFLNSVYLAVVNRKFRPTLWFDPHGLQSPNYYVCGNLST
jgi:hypothetical protein